MNKSALLIGINYKKTRYELRGCINDINNIRELLINKYKYNKNNIKSLSEEHNITPTKQNIINEIKNSINFIKKNNIEEFWFHFSGHGHYIYDKNNDELDRKG